MTCVTIAKQCLHESLSFTYPRRHIRNQAVGPWDVAVQCISHILEFSCRPREWSLRMNNLIYGHHYPFIIQYLVVYISWPCLNCPYGNHINISMQQQQRLFWRGQVSYGGGCGGQTDPPVLPFINCYGDFRPCKHPKTGLKFGFVRAINNIRVAVNVNRPWILSTPTSKYLLH
ncbi:hypothetical protein Fmac_032745 [Flemingia macrophylla]|uniref:Uncharacterized protein n=1 Tax=Flemingia macrophylla TaxID=520843 RepID=A0ABD1L5U1_9FABA